MGEAQPLDWSALLACLPDGIFVVSRPDERVTFANAEVERLLGYEPGALLGRPAVDLAWGPGGDVVMRAALERVRGGDVFEARVPARRADGERVDVDVWARSTGDHVVWRVRAAATPSAPRPSRTEASFRAMLDQLPDAIGVHRGGVFLYANEAAARLYGAASAAELIGTPVLERVHPDDRAQVSARLVHLASGARSVPFSEERLVRKDGSVASALIAGVWIDFDGEPAVVAIARDLEEQRRVQAQLAHADRMASVGALAAGVAHEINNPLTYVMLRLDAISLLGRRLRHRVGELKARISHRLGEREAAEAIEATIAHLADDLDVHVRGASDGADRVRRIVSDLRVFARADDESLQPTDVQRALDVAVGMAMHELRHRARVVRDEGPASHVRASEGKLVQVFLNLLVNAGQALGADDPEENEVRVELGEQNGRVRVVVADTGCGIPPENLPRLFEPFFTTKPVGAGTGLGLAVCHGIVTSLGGTIRVESTPGKGSRFIVELPAVDPAPLSTSGQAGPIAAGEPMLRILVVDDEAPIGRALRAALADLGEVVVVASGAEAREQIEREAPFDLVLTDVRMPGVSGLELLRWIRASRPALANRVLLMTGGRLTPDEIAAAEADPSRWIEKPFDLRELRARIEALLGDDDGGPPEAA